MPESLSQRIRRAVELAGGGDEVARRAGIPRRTLGNYLAARNEPKASVIAQLSMATGVKIEWLVTGEGPMQPGEGPPPAAASTPVATVIDEDLMARVAEGIADVYQTENARIAALLLVRLATRMYADLVAVCDTPEERLAGLRMALQQLRRDLRTPEAGEKGGNRAS